MNAKQAAAQWDHLRLAHGITLRLLEQVPADQIAKAPIAGMRSPKELLVHTYTTMIQGCPEGVVSGEIKDTEATEKGLCERIQSKDDLVKFVNDAWTAGDKSARAITDAQLAADVKTPWGMSMKGDFVMTVIHDEYFHHRGQLFAYVRTYGVTPLMMWDFANNAPQFQPTAQATA